MVIVAFQEIIFLPVCQYASLPVCQFASPQTLSLIISSKGVFDPLITMVPSVFRQNVPFGRYKHFCTKITILPNTMKIESWVPQAMDYPMPPTFGRIDALRESSVEITKITDSTKRHENRCVGAPGHGRTDCTHVWSLRCTDIDFGSSLYASFMRV